MVLIQHLYGLASLRRTAEEVPLNIVYRWFLGYSLQEETPHFSTVSYTFQHRFTEETVDQVFCWILEEVAQAGYLSPKAVFIDGTHIKANANAKKQVMADDARYTLNTRNSTIGGKRPSNRSLQTPRKNRPCVIRSTEAWPRLPTG